MTYNALDVNSLEKIRQRDPMEFVKIVRTMLMPVPGSFYKKGACYSKAGKTFLPLTAKQVSQMKVIGISDFIRSPYVKYRNLYLLNSLNGLTYMVVAFLTTDETDPYKDDFRIIKYYAVVMDSYTNNGKLIGEILAKKYRFNVHFSGSLNNNKGRYRLRTTINKKLFEIEDVLLQGVYSNMSGAGCEVHHRNYKFDCRRDSIVYLDHVQHKAIHDKEEENSHIYTDRCVGDGVIPIPHKTIK